MNSLARSVARTAARTTPRGLRSVATDASYFARRQAVQEHAQASTELWRKITYYVAFPSIAVCMAWVYNVEAEHHAHEEHEKEQHGGKLPEPPAFEYLNRRVKPFPWGKNVLFFNPEVNKDMEQEE
ncbi:cytochrome c oxidase, subunit VIa [Scleroderma yunnanense]